jgi:hypothetical protein
VLDARVYRAAFLPALVALFVAAFSLADRPQPATTRLAADAFDGARAFGTGAAPLRNSLRELAATFPDRRPGSVGDHGVADRVAQALDARDAAGRPVFQVTRSSIAGGSRDAGDIETVVGVRPGLSSHRIVVLAHRDARTRPAPAQLSGTAALLELARLASGRDLRKTLVLVSTSGGSSGYSGARAWARANAAGAPVDAVLVLGDLAGDGVRKPWVVPWSAGGSPAPLALQRTVENAVRAQVGSPAGAARATAQWVRRAVPLTLSEQGVIDEAGLPAVLLGISGERGPAPGARVDQGTLQAFGRAALRSVTAIDAAGSGPGGASPFARGPDGIVTMRNVLPGWSVRLVVAALLLPALLAALDSFFRVRRRRMPVAPWALWLVAAGAPVIAAWIWARLLGLTGVLDAPAAPPAPGDVPLHTGGAVALASVVVVAGLAAFGLRPLRVRRRRAFGTPSAGALAAATGVALAAVSALTWTVNPYAAALLLPAAHLWLVAAAPSPRLSAPWLAAAVLAGLAPALFVLGYYTVALGAGPPELAWIALLTAAAGNVSLLGILTLAVFVAGAMALVAIARDRRRIERAAGKDGGEPIRTRGPMSYAGPGSLGGTDSALRR